MTHLIAASRPQCFRESPRTLKKRTGENFALITRKEELNAKRLQKLSPRYIFLPHWSYFVPSEVYKNYECIIFHMTDVPYGRGGSPLQNLIVRGHRKTMMTALRCVAGLDAGPVYLKRPLTLQGTAEEIYERAARLIEDMIVTIVKTQPLSRPQKGRPVTFKRRTPEQGNLDALTRTGQVYDFIRMLDAKGYPQAYLSTKNLRFEFSNAKVSKDTVTANVRITRKTYA